jgi:hypothetical protein
VLGIGTGRLHFQFGRELCIGARPMFLRRVPFTREIVGFVFGRRVTAVERDPP